MGGWIIYSWECTLLSMKTCLETLPIYIYIQVYLRIYIYMQTHTPIHLCFHVGFHQPFLFCNTSPESSTCSCFSARARLHTTMSPTHVRNTVQPQVQFFTHSTFHRLQFSQTTLFTDSTSTRTSPL